MFVLTTIADTIRIPPQMFAQSTLESVHQEIEKKYPNRVIMDVGLVICRYGDVLEIGDGVCVAGDGSAHHEVIFRLIVFRPHVEEVCVGTICESNEEGVRVSLGNFFHDIFIPAYWMLNPSQFNHQTSVWVWTPNYDDEEGGEDNAEDGNQEVTNEDNGGETEDQEEEQGYQMLIGSEIRFKVKSINFTQVTNTIKGVQARTTSTTSRSGPGAASGTSTGTGQSSSNQDADNVIGSDADDAGPKRRSSSVDLSESSKIPASMHITASICEDGLGLISWWTNEEEEDEEAIENEEGGEYIDGDHTEGEYYEDTTI